MISKADVTAAMEEIRASGREPTTRAILAMIGGSKDRVCDLRAEVLNDETEAREKGEDLSDELKTVAFALARAAQAEANCDHNATFKSHATTGRC